MQDDRQTLQRMLLNYAHILNARGANFACLPGMVLIIIELKGLHPRKPSIPRQLKKFGYVGLTKSSKWISCIVFVHIDKSWRKVWADFWLQFFLIFYLYQSTWLLHCRCLPFVNVILFSHVFPKFKWKYEQEMHCNIQNAI